MAELMSLKEEIATLRQNQSESEQDTPSSKQEPMTQ
jgi:hypothetical protein